MAGGFAKDGAVQDQIDASIDDAVGQIRRRMPKGRVSLATCHECGEPIPEARRRAVPGVQMCVECQAIVDGKQTIQVGYNRRGSKGSQLR
ncbi:MAG: hypothetical protein A2289_10220 [Deltaproteobacteria bacterium RIFOXYA12_FULL_58_15]|nr:MAG: hypothetical protein A2289_10220 [Deltaproteobacteria bacterium RIFOXYA12_FULL_58_15]OGR08984.1 MAG: hypothetical protein A2341_26880 [Deltaproteobacteria bacterium RIFOXYB12_FULL_58_9]